MRVIAGALKGRRLVTPRGSLTRPTADQVRIALMDTLMPWLPGARLLDLFAGAGGVGIEGLSRGATHAVLVERDRRAAAALRENVEALGLGEMARVLHMDVERALARLAAEGQHFDVVFLDPPYDTSLVPDTLAWLGGGRLIRPGGVV
ncbi:MAG: 16S rRNA (guanine(966)-N(2))-methyltransferase RsmD, partial [Candidatus Rokuibacteriota bacterium]